MLHLYYQEVALVNGCFLLWARSLLVSNVPNGGCLPPSAHRFFLLHNSRLNRGVIRSLRTHGNPMMVAVGDQEERTRWSEGR